MSRYREPQDDWGDLAGFGTVYAVGDIADVGFTLSNWRWRSATAADFPVWLEAKYFGDNPAHVRSSTLLGQRFAASTAFAEAANAVFDTKDGESAPGRSMWFPRRRNDLPASTRETMRTCSPST